MEKLGWRQGQNIYFDIRWAGGSTETMREIAADFVALGPDVIVASGTPAVGALKRATSTIPIVFVAVNEPVVQGFVASFSHPGGNVTGFTQTDFVIAGKSIDLLRLMAPTIEHIGLMYNPTTYSFYDAYIERFRTEARLSTDLTRVSVQRPSDIIPAVKDFSKRPGGGLVVMVDAFNTINQPLIQTALQENPIPHIVPWQPLVVRGALMSYGPDVLDIFARSADYVHRILKGTKPSELPVQAPIRYELTVNLKTAKALDLKVPSSILAIADQIIE